MEVTLQTSNNFSSASTFGSLSAGYGLYGSGSASFANVMEQSLATGGMTFEIGTQGVDLTNVTIPISLDQLDKDILAGELATAMATATGDPRGLVLTNMEAIPMTPPGEGNSLTQAIVGEAAGEVYASLIAMLNADDWLNPGSKLAFLSKHTLSGAMTTIDDQLLSARFVLSEELDDLWQLALNYFENGDVTAEGMLNLEIMDVQAARLILEDILLQLQDAETAFDLFDSDENQIISVMESSGPGAQAFVRVWFWNVALFTDGTVAEFEDALLDRLTIFPRGGIPVPLTYENGGILGAYLVDDLSNNPNSSPVGLLGLQYIIVFNGTDTTDGVDIRIEDHIGRVRFETHNWCDDPEPFPLWLNSLAGPGIKPASECP